jgi:hypothetical protein
MDQVTCDLSKNEKQEELVTTVLREVAYAQASEKDKERFDPALVGYRYFFFGGAVRGGKTFGCLAVLVILCRMFPGSRWHVIRRSMTDLKATTIPSLEKMKLKKVKRWKRADNDYFVEFANGSRIYFISENFKNDKDLNFFKGLETNGFLLEQVEELQADTWTKCLERSGSWYVPNMPPAFNFATFNPTYNWVKEQIYDKATTGELKKPYYYIETLPDNNPFVTADQWQAWRNMDDDSYNRFVRGLWTFKVDGQYFSSFSDGRNLARGLEFNPRFDLWLSFDFNVDPMTCTVHQTDYINFSHTLKEYRIPNSDTYELCARIREDWDELRPYHLVTGDASGLNRMSGVRGHINHYQIIKNELELHDDQFRVPSSNPGISESRIFCNSILQRFPECLIDEDNCPYLVKDLRFVLAGVDQQGNITIQKKGFNQYANENNEQLTHLSDTQRYYFHAALYEFMSVPRS